MDVFSQRWGSRDPLDVDGCTPASIPIVVPDCNTCSQDPVVPPMNAVAPVITGVPVVGSTLTANQGLWVPSGGITYMYQWKADGEIIIGAMGQTFVVPEGYEGVEVTVVVTATNSAGTASVETAGVIIFIAPENTILPVISGTPEAGETLTVDDGTWTGSAPITYTYQWLADGVALPGETANSFTVTTAQNGADITVEVTATNLALAVTVETLPVTIVFAPINSVPPTVSGTTQVGSTLTASTGTWTGTAPIAYAYQWKRNGIDIVAATSASYLLVLADEGTDISVVVTASNAQGSDSATAPSVLIESPPTFAAKPVISGTPVVGQTLSTTNGTVTGATPITYTYQWKAAGSPITGETNQTYVVGAGLEGVSITVTVTATNTIGSTDDTAVAVVIASAPVNTTAPSISGTPEVGQTLTASTGTWTGTAPITYTYKWKRNGVDIPGATGSTYVAQAADVD